MSYRRYHIDLAFKEPISAELRGLLVAMVEVIHRIKPLAERINAGQHSEEDTTRATYHICHHDTNEPCEPEQDI